MSSQLIERALAEWREGERLLLDLPRLDPDHETVRLEVLRLRETYQRLSIISTDSHDQIEDCRTTIEAAHQTILRVRLRQDAHARPPAGPEAKAEPV
jgi:hypothetical protein